MMTIRVNQKDVQIKCYCDNPNHWNPTFWEGKNLGKEHALIVDSVSCKRCSHYFVIDDARLVPKARRHYPYVTLPKHFKVKKADFEYKICGG